MRFVRSPNLVAYWRDQTFVLEEFERRSRITASPLVIQLLAAFDRPRSLVTAARGFAPYSPRSVKQQLGALTSFGFLVPVSRTQRPRALAKAWDDCFPAAYYHFSGRDLPLTGDPVEKTRFFRARLAESRQPPLYKNYPRRKRTSLPRASIPMVPLEEVLRRRETVRTFQDDEIELGELAALIGGTWGQTGWLKAGLLGRLLAKTSPSAGARHPIECYVVTFRVRGLPAGLFHYSVQKDILEELKLGDLREEAVRFASGQEWVGTAAFVCIMTAVVARSLWKYPATIGYKAMLLDAGHLGQTFSLLATALGLGPFTTGAIQQSRIERLLGIDGVTEIPLYLCGAGTPAGPQWSLRRPLKGAGDRPRTSAPKSYRPVNDKGNRR